MADYRSAGTVAVGVAGTARTLNAPAGVVAGDRLIACFAQLQDTDAGAGVINTLSGWTLLASQVHDFGRYFIFGRVASGSDPYNFVHNNAGTPQNWVGRAFAFENVGSVVVAAQQLNGQADGFAGSTANHVCPGMTLAGSLSMFVNIVLDSSGWFAHTGHTSPGTVTERADDRATGAPYNNQAGVLLATSQPGAGATGTRTFTSQAATHSYGFSLELTDAAPPATVTQKRALNFGPYLFPFRRATRSYVNPPAITVDSITEAAAFGAQFSAVAAASATLTSAAGAGETSSGSAGTSGSISAGVGAGAVASGAAAAVGSISAGVGLSSATSAQAAVQALFTAGLAAAESHGRFTGTLGALSAQTSAGAVVSALAQAAGAILQGANLGESWAARAQAAASLAAGGNFGEEFLEETEGAQLGAATAGTAAAATFLSAATALASLSPGAGLGMAVSAIATTLGQLSAGASLGATFAFLSGNEADISAGVTSSAVFGIAVAAVASLVAVAGMGAVQSAMAVSSAALASGASFDAAFSAVGGISSVFPPDERIHVAARSARVLTVQRQSPSE